MLNVRIITLTLAAALLIPALPSLAQNGSAAGQPSEAKLIAVLRSDASITEKSAACRQLAVVGTGQAVPVLAGLLADEKLSHMARYALEPIPDAAADDALRDALGKVKGRLLVGIVNSIGVRRDAKSIGALTGLLRDSDPQVAMAAGVALSRIGNDDAAKALRQAVDSAPEAARVALYDGCVRCAEAMAAQGKLDAAIDLYDVVRNGNPPRQLLVAATRGAILARQSRGLPLLSEQIHSADLVRFGIALRLAYEMPGTEMTRFFAAELPKVNADRQILLTQALGNRKDAAALPAVLELAKSGKDLVRLTALRVLPQIGDVSIVPFLFNVAANESGEPAKAAQLSLATLGGKEVDSAVAAMLDNPDVKLRRVAMEVLGKRYVTSAMPVLVKATQDPDQEVRISAIRALEEVGTPAELPALGAVLAKAEGQEMDSAERAMATISVRSGDSNGCAEKVVGILSQSSVPARKAMLRVLRSVGGAKALATVAGATKDSNAEIQDAAVRALCEWTSADAAGNLLDLAKNSDKPNFRTLALRGYIRLSRDRGLQPAQRLEMCQTALGIAQRDDEKRQVLGSLSAISTPESLKVVVSLLENQGTRDEASLAAVSIGEKLVQRNRAAVADAMKKVVAAKPSEDVAKRAQALLDRASR